MKISICLAAALSLALIAAAPTSKPDKDAKADLSTPKGALKAFFGALMKGDAAGAKKAVISNDDQNKFIDEMTSATASFKKLKETATDKFGPEGATIAPMGEDRQLDMTDKAEEKIDGENATVAMPNDPNPPTPLKKVGDDWKVDLANMPNMDQMKLALPMFAEMKKFADGFEKDVKADKYASAADAKTAFEKGMQEMMIGMATRAATQQAPTQEVKPAK